MLVSVQRTAATAAAMVLLAGLWSGAEATWGRRDRVLLADIKTLTFSAGALTNGRRSAPVPQLACVGGDACADFVPEIVQCTNMGFDGRDASWRCEADLPSFYRFGRTDVSCEGYDNPDDPYILAGSCGLMYTMSLTQEGKDAKRNAHHQTGGQYSSYSYTYGQKTESDGFQSLLNLVGFVIIAIILFQCFMVPRRGVTAGAGSNYPGGGPDGYNPRGHPPPYDAPGCDPNPPLPRAPGGFWTGAGIGGALGYMLGRQSSNARYVQPPFASAPYFAPSPFQPMHFSAPPRTSSPTPSESSRRSTGYGNTLRR